MNCDILRTDMEEIYSKMSWDRFNGKSILITGAYGMLASYLTYFFMFLKEEKSIDLKLVLLVRSEEKLKACIGDDEREYIEVVYSNLNEPIDVAGKIDFIIHAASLASPQYYATNPVDVMLPNIIGTYNLLNLAKSKNTEGFLLFSTGDIYGRVTGQTEITEQCYGIMDTLDIHNCYSESKRAAETLCYSFMIQYEVQVKIARIWHTYSPTMNEKSDSRVFASFIKNIVENKNIEMKSDGSGMRSFCYITDAVYGLLKILLDGKPGEAYNVCNEEQFVSIFDLAQMMIRLRPEKNLMVKRREPDKNYVENVHLSGQIMRPSSAKLKKLGWLPEVDLKTGFDRVLKFKGM